MTNALPAWHNMSDRDKSAALHHVAKVHFEGSVSYATEHYPAEYQDDPVLTALNAEHASQHARTVAVSWNNAFNRLGNDEVWRLYELPDTAKK